MSSSLVRGGRAAFVVNATLLLVVAGVGALAYLGQLEDGHATTVMGGPGGVVWGLYVLMDGLYLGAGMALMACGCVARFSRDRDLEALAGIAMPAALACFLAAGLSVLADQGRPCAALVHLSAFARPHSPLFATFTGFVAVCVVGAFLHGVLTRRPDLAVFARHPSPWRPLRRLLAGGYRGTQGERHRRQQVGFWMSLLLLPALAVPLAALAAIFSARPGRPLLLVVSEAITFTLSSGVAGLSLLALGSALVRRLSGPRAALTSRAFARLGRALLLLDGLAVLAAVATQMVALHAGEAAVVAGARAQQGEPYGGYFFGGLALYLLAGFLLWGGAWRRGPRPATVGVAAGLAALAVLLQRYVSLIAWQTHGLLLPYPAGAYAPSGTEVAVEVGIAALALLFVLVWGRLVPPGPVMRDERSVRPVPAGARRRWLTRAWLALGLGVTALGLVLSMRAGTEPFLDPLVTGSPGIFIAGLAMLVATGAVYELVPEPAAREEARARASSPSTSSPGPGASARL